MTFLTAGNSYHSGADLWAIPNAAHLRSAVRLDWYLNFQLSRARSHPPHALSSTLIELLQKCGMSNSRYFLDEQDIHERTDKATELKTTPLMIESSQLLPNRWLIQVNYNNNLPAWCQQISDLWTGLRKPSLRIFLPTSMSSSEFQTTWKQVQSFDDFGVVVD